MKGARRHGLGWQASVFVKGVGRVFQPFPLHSTQAEIDEWRRTERARLELQREVLDRRATAGTFAADAVRYLAAVRAMPGYKDRARDIALWVEAFGTRRRATIKPVEIRTLREQWLLRGPKRVYNRKTKVWELRDIPLAGSTVNHRLRALENMYTVLSPGGYNPVRAVPEADEPDPEDRALPYNLIEAILAAMPDVGQGVKGQRRALVSKSKARLRLIAWTGITPSQMMRLVPEDILVDTLEIRIPGRRKGKGIAGGWRPVPIDGGPALRTFVDANAFGSFSKDSLRQSFQRACKRLGLPKLNPYDLRHSYATLVLERTGDIKATQHLMSHADERTTRRYSQRAVPGWLRAAMAKVGSLRHHAVPEREK